MARRRIMIAGDNEGIMSFVLDTSLVGRIFSCMRYNSISFFLPMVAR